MAAIALGVAVMLAVDITNLSTITSITNLFAETSGRANLVISATASEQGFSEATVRRVSRVPGVTAVAPSLRINTMLPEESGQTSMSISVFVASASGLILYGIDPSLDRQVRDYKIVAGEFLPSERDTQELVLVKDYADDKGLRVGSKVLLVMPGGIEQFRVIGLMSKDGPGRLNNGAFGIIPLITAQRLTERGSKVDQIDVVAVSDQATSEQLDRLKAALQAELGEDYSVTYPAAQGKRVTRMLDTYQLGLSFFGAVAVFVGAFLIYNAFSMTVVERTRETGLLRAIGMTRRQIMSVVLLEAGVLGMFGSTLGVVAGRLLAGGLINVTQLFLEQRIGAVPTPPRDVLASFVVGLAVTLLSASVPAWQSSRVSPLQALRVRGNRQEGWILRAGWGVGIALIAFSGAAIYVAARNPAVVLWLGSSAVFTLFLGATLLIPSTMPAWERVIRPLACGLYGNEGRLGAANLQRARLRSALTATALVVGVAMILAVNGLSTAMKYDIESWLNAYIGGDLTAYSSTALRAELAARLQTMDGVAVASPVRYVDMEYATAGGGWASAIFTAVDPPSYQRVASFVFSDSGVDVAAAVSQLDQRETVFVSSVIAEKTGLGAGDRIRLRTRRGEQEFAIAAVVVDFYNRGMVVEGNRKDLRRYFGLDDASLVFLRVQAGQDVTQVADRLQEAYGKREHLTVTTNETIKGSALRLADQTYGLFNVLAMISIIVAAFGLVNTLTASVTERTREIGALRGVGMTRWQVRRMVLAEAAALSLIGGVTGLAFGLFFSRMLLTVMEAIRGYNLTYIVPRESILISLLLALVVSQLAALWPANRAAGLRVVEAIQYE